MRSDAPNLVQVLEDTLKRIQRTSELAPDDPAMVELERSLVRAIAELELQRRDESSAA